MNWTEDRVEEFKKLEELIGTTSLLNNGNMFLERTTKAIQLAKELQENDLRNGRVGFLSFLRDIIIADRQTKS